MENQDYYTLINQGIEKWNNWRVKNYKKNPGLMGVDLSGKKLNSVNFRGVNLSEADLSGADLSGADLSGANLTKIVALRANFEGAIFTGACIEDWNIDRTTNFKNVVCDYIFLKEDGKERRPASSTFMLGEFTKLFSRSTIVDLNLLDGNVMEYVSRRASDIIVERTKKDNSIKFRYITILVSIFGIIGVGLITTFSNLFINQAVEEQFSKEYSELKKNFESEVISFKNSTFLRTLSFSLQSLSNKSVPSDLELEELKNNINLLLQKIKDNPQLQQDPQFNLIIKSLVNSLIDNGELETLKIVDDKLQNIIISDNELASNMSDYLGFVILSEVIPPNEVDPLEMKRLVTYLRQDLLGNYPENFIFWSMLINFKNNENKRNLQTSKLFTSLQKLNEYDQEFFFKKLDTYLVPLTDGANQRDEILYELMTEFKNQYNDELEKIKLSLTENNPTESLDF